MTERMPSSDTLPALLAPLRPAEVQLSHTDPPCEGFTAERAQTLRRIAPPRIYPLPLEK
jgi:hypothetical protein